MFTKTTTLGNSSGQNAYIGYDKGSSPNQGNVIIKNFSIYNRALLEDEIKQLYNSKFKLKSNGDVSNIIVKEKPIIPADVYYFPLIENAKDQYGIISPVGETNTVYTRDGVWVGTATTNYYNNGTNNSPAPITNNGGIVTDVSLTPEEMGFLFTKGAKTWKCIKTGSGNQWHGWLGTYGNWITGNAGYYFTISGYVKTVNKAGVGLEGFEPWKTDWSAKVGTQVSSIGNAVEDNKWNFYSRTCRLTEAYTGAIGDDVTAWGYSTQSGILYFHANMWEKKPFPSPFCNGSRGETYLTYNFNSSIGLDWNGDWSIVYWKKPIGTRDDTFNHYNIESLGCNNNSVGGGYAYWGKLINSNSIIVYPVNQSQSFTNYFNKWHMISFVKNGTTGTWKFWGIDGTIITKTYTYGTIASNYYVTQYGYDFKLGGWDNGNPCNSYYKDLIVAKRALTDTELQTLYNIQMRLYNNNRILLIRNGISEANLL